MPDVAVAATTTTTTNARGRFQLPTTVVHSTAHYNANKQRQSKYCMHVST